jgi:hypothetical protein
MALKARMRRRWQPKAVGWDYARFRETAKKIA